tara:strand:- start:19515 stop:19721 length:207 start_codon:yes stop_codon:yes gene_type:complete
MLSTWKKSILRREELAREKEIDPSSFGCVVCCAKGKLSKKMCNKHYQRYYRAEINKRRRKGIEFPSKI